MRHGRSEGEEWEKTRIGQSRRPSLQKQPHPFQQPLVPKTDISHHDTHFPPIWTTYIILMPLLPLPLHYYCYHYYYSIAVTISTTATVKTTATTTTTIRITGYLLVP